MSWQFFIITLSLASIYFPSAAFAQNTAPPATIENLNLVVQNGVSAVISVAFASLTMLIFGGYRYLSAGPDQKAAVTAQHTITYSIMGLVITLSAWVILSLAETFLGVNLSVFDICLPGGCG